MKQIKRWLPGFVLGILCMPSDSAVAQAVAVNPLEAAYRRAERFLHWNKSDYVINDSIIVHWLSEGEALWYRRDLQGDGSVYVHVDTATGKRRPAFDHPFVARELSRLTGAPVKPEQLAISGLELSADGSLRFQRQETSYRCAERRCEVAARSDSVVPGEVIAPGGKYAVFFRGHNLWVRDTASGEERALTDDGEPDYAWGISTGTDLSAVTRRRQGRVDAPLLVFSPDGSSLVTQRVDQRRVAPLHLLEQAPRDGSRRPKLHSMRYAMAGDAEKPMGRLAVFDLSAGTRVDVDYPPVELPYVPDIHPARAGVRWQADGRGFYYVHYYAYGRGYAILRVDAASGEVAHVAERRAQATAVPAVSGAMPAVFMPVGRDGVLWYSDESGWGHLYHTDGGGEPLQITRGEWTVQNILRIDESAGVVYFTRGRAEQEGNPYHTVVSSVRLDGSDLRTLTPEQGVHRVTPADFSPDYRFFVDRYASLQDAGRTLLRHVDGRVIAELEAIEIALTAALRPQPEPFTALAADGTTRLWGSLFLPSDFDEKKSYPVIDSVYPGPQSGRVHHDLVNALYDRSGSPQALAELGFVVITLDGRGTPGRSRQFNYQADGSLLGKAGYLEDHVAVLRQLAAARPWMDLDRVGIYGHSGGGYAAAHALLTYPDFFRVAVASAGNHEQRAYHPAWGESYLGPESGDNYAKASNPALAANLRGRLYIVVGNMDDNVHPTHSYQLVQALIDANRDFDMLVLPNANHSFAEEKAYFTRRLWDYFVTHLMGERPPANYAIDVVDR